VSAVRLSDTEIDALLADVTSAATETLEPQAAPARAPGQNPKSVGAHVFGAATPQLTGELGALGILHERFARALRRSLLPLLRYQPKVTLGRIESRAYDDYVSGQHGQLVCFNIVRVEPLRGNCLIAVPPKLVSALVDGFFGGKARLGTRAQTEFTPTEERVIQRLIESMCAGLARAWEDVAALRFAYVGTESNAQLAIFLETDDAVLTCPFVVELKEGEIVVDVLYPVQMLKPVLPALRSKVQAERIESSADWRERMIAALLEVPIPLRAVLAEPVTPLGALAQLAPGDTLPIMIGDDIRLLAGAWPIACGTLGAARGLAALQLTRIAATPIAQGSA